MLYTPHFNLNLPEGTDIVNPLVQDNPNYSAIDSAMFSNKQSVIGSATELTSGTVHTITRANTDSNYVRFTATSNWTAGDSMVVDSTPVSVYLSDGTTPATGAYVINTEVLLFVNGSRVTIITSGKQTAAQTPYDNTSSGLNATDTQNAIDEVNSEKVGYLTSALKETYSFPKNASEISGGNDSHTISHDGIAFLVYQFDGSEYSQVSVSVNGITPFGVLSCGNVASNETNVISFPVKVGDVIAVSYYAAYGMNSVVMRVM